MYVNFVRKPPYRSKIYQNSLKFLFTILHLHYDRPAHTLHLVRPHLHLPFDQSRHPPHGPFTPSYLLQSPAASPSSHPPSTRVFDSPTNNIGLRFNGDKRRERRQRISNPTKHELMSRRHKTFTPQNLILTSEFFLTTSLVTDTFHQKSVSFVNPSL